MVERFMEYIVGHVAEDVAGVVKEIALPMPVSQNENLAMVVHEVIFDRLDCDRIDATRTSCACWFAKRNGYTGGFDAEGAISDTIAWAKRELSCGEVSGLLSNYMVQYGDPAQVWRKFVPPILIAQSTMYIGVRGENNVPVRDIVYRIGYTLEKVSKDAFIAALIS